MAIKAVTDAAERARGMAAELLAHLRPPYPPVALEVNRREAVIVRLKPRRRGKPLIEAHAVRAMDETAMPSSIFDHTMGSVAELAGKFRELFEASGTRPGRVSLVLPDNLTKISLLTLPERPASPRQLDELVRSKMRRAVPFRLDDASISYQLLPGEGRRVGVLVVLAPRLVVERFEQALEAVGARVGLIDISTPSLFNLCRERVGEASRGGRDAALLNCAANYFSLLIVRDERLVFFRCKTLPPEAAMTNGGNGFLVRELANSLSYYREKLSGQGLELVLVRGLGVEYDEIAGRLGELDLHAVEPVTPANGVELVGRGWDAELAVRLSPALGAAAGRVR